MLQIRPERAEDLPAVHSLYVRAFPTEAEAEAVDKLRARGAYLLSLVADFDGAVVGHIFFTPVTIEEDGAFFDVVGLAPMAVQPELQRRGIGSLLVRAGLEALKQLGFAAVIVLGHAEYYPR
ncbi:MAG: N-acetyltransferase, partial [Anaerolineales bacterium]